jgi:hypothetical protein
MRHALISFPTQQGHNYTVWQSSSLKGTISQIAGPIPGKWLGERGDPGGDELLPGFGAINRAVCEVAA